jgi:FixJ family two-component response regulator
MGMRLPSVVLVEDDADLLSALKFNMETEGYSVSAFPDAESLLGLPDVPAADCIVVDHRLPRMDGMFLIEMMRARGMTTPAILITSQPGRILRDRCSSVDVPIIEKPIIGDELCDAIRKAAAR